jgi:hypothetical protein
MTRSKKGRRKKYSSKFVIISLDSFLLPGGSTSLRTVTSEECGVRKVSTRRNLDQKPVDWSVLESAVRVSSLMEAHTKQDEKR